MVPPKNFRLCNDIQKAQKRLDQLHLAPFQQKQKKTRQTFYPMRNQLCFLDVYDYKGYNEPLAFDSSFEENQFFDNQNNKKNQVFGNPQQNVGPMYLGRTKHLMDVLDIPYIGIDVDLTVYGAIDMIRKEVSKNLVPF